MVDRAPQPMLLLCDHLMACFMMIRRQKQPLVAAALPADLDAMEKEHSA
jgi:hypothetical protein